MKNRNLQIGDMIRINRGLYYHVGIFVGNRTVDGRNVVHNDKGGGVVLSTFADFSGGHPVFLHKPASGNHFQREEIAKRALALLGRKFDLLTFNCEHAANWAQSSKAESPQLAVFGGLALLLGLAFILRKAN